MTLKLVAVLSLATAFAYGALPSPKDSKQLLQEAKDVTGADKLVKDPIAHVVFFAGVQCPIAKDYIERIRDFHKVFNETPPPQIDPDLLRGRFKKAPRTGKVQFYVVYSNLGDKRAAVEAIAKDLPVPVIFEGEEGKQKFADHLDATRLSQTFVFNKEFDLLYRGSFDDQFTIDGAGKRNARAKVRKSYVKLAIEDILADQKVFTQTIAYGCIIERPHRAEKESKLTYTKDIAPILRARCEVCHGPRGAMEAYPLTTYEEVKSHARTVAERVGQKAMPPWNADPHIGKFANDRNLTEAERATVIEWVESGVKKGDDKDLPPVRKLLPAADWEMESRHGEKPDVVFELPEPFDVPSSTKQAYVPYHFAALVPLDAKDYDKKIAEKLGDGERWLKWSEVKPTAPSVVHHVIPFVLRPVGERVTDKEPGLGEKIFENSTIQKMIGNYHFDIEGESLNWHMLFYGMKLNKMSWEVGRYVPGEAITEYPEDFGVRVPKGSNIVFEMHYTPEPTARRDQTRVAIKWWDKGKIPKYEVNTIPLSSFAELKIPPKHPNHEIRAKYVFAKDALILGARPHAHLRGRDFLYEHIHGDGRVEKILSVPRYDFNNQPYYRWETPIKAKKGDTINLTAHFNNSESNSSLTKEDTEEEIRFGVQTNREMMFGYLTVAFLNEQPEDGK